MFSFPSNRIPGGQRSARASRGSRYRARYTACCLVPGSALSLVLQRTVGVQSVSTMLA